MHLSYREDLQVFRLFAAELKHASVSAKELLPKYLPLMQKQKSQKVLNDFVAARAGFNAFMTETRDIRQALDQLYKGAGIKPGVLGHNTYKRLLESETSMCKDGIIHPEVKEAYKDLSNLSKVVSKLEKANTKLNGKLLQISRLYNNLVGNLIAKEGMSEKTIQEYSATGVSREQSNTKSQQQRNQQNQKRMDL